ncbi:AAA family ATPase [Mycoplasma seminis]|uniref:AAA family ATPase n=1 Tax=Mycoplasma seminis TaxID=512749 RepID=A0ABY9HA76_9MOLU|nr:AAA family ATPase [Mycoplasma seminis]WLP85228.1 AAA family ATPase [Mycoplasma seminis]
MSVHNSFIKQLQNKVGIKNIFIIKGNSSDIYSPECIEVNLPQYANKGNVLLNVNELLTAYLFNKGIEKISFFSPSFDNIYFDENEGILKKEVKSLETEENNLNPFDDIQEFQISQPNDINSYINSVVDELKLSSQSSNQKAYVIDLCDFIINDKNQGLIVENIGNLINAFTTYYQSNVGVEIRKNLSLYLVIKNEQLFSSLYFDNNSSIQTIVVQNPNYDERKRFINKLETILCVDKTNWDQDLEKIVAITDGLQFKQIMQICKMSQFHPEISDFKSLFRLWAFDQNESEWEKISIERINDCNNFLSSKVMGQEYAVEKVAQSIQRSFLGMQGVLQDSDNSKKPKGILFFAGPTGVGKTELVKALSEFIFNDKNRIIRFDMSEFNHEHSDQRLIGAPPGYVGYEKGGELTNQVLAKPFSILLFDEIEKAHPKIMDKFLQILEDGRLTSAKGELVDFSETFIIFTSNIGSSSLPEGNNPDIIRMHFIKSVMNHFTNELKRPEILNRIGLKNVIPFNLISDRSVQNRILDSKLSNFITFIKKSKNIDIRVSEEAKESIYQTVIKRSDKKLGGRGLIAELESVFVDSLSQYLISIYSEIIRIQKEDSKALIIINVNYDANNNKIAYSVLHL